MKKFLVGDTLKFTWISSGVSASESRLNIWSGSETLVASMSMVDSGNGHFYALWQTDADSHATGFYVGETMVNVNGYEHPRRDRLRLVYGQVD